MNNKEIKQQAVIAALPKCIELVSQWETVHYNERTNEMVWYTEEGLNAAADMAVQYAEALMKRLNE